MGISRNELGRDEQVIDSMRTHGKALIMPAAALIVFSAGLGLGVAALPIEGRPWTTWVLVALFVALVIWIVLLPFLRWLTSTYTITNRRIITRKGILNKMGHDLPLRRVNNVNTERHLVDRMLGCGTLVLETAAGNPLVLPDVPGVQKVHVLINELLFAPEDDGDALPADE